MLIKIRKIREKDLNEALSIYNYFIENSYSNFEENILTLNKFKTQYKKITGNKLPFLIAEYKKSVVGIAYLNNYRYKSGYKYSFENSIYVHHNYINKGIGSKLLKKLIDYSKKNKNIKNIIAVIGDSKNKISINIHKKNGFKKIGILKNIGYKKRKWIDSVYMQLIL